jgi:hypothetical protein
LRPHTIAKIVVGASQTFLSKANNAPKSVLPVARESIM